MKANSLITYLFVCVSLLSVSAKAQQTFNVAGNTAKINGFTFDYSIGELVLVSTENSSNLIVTQGLLQPLQSFSNGHSSTDAILSLNDNPIKVYPNPTSQLVFVESYENGIIDYAYNLYDATGKIVMSQKGQTQAGLNKLELNLQSLASGSYYLMIQKRDTDGATQNHSYKIQKVN